MSAIEPESFRDLVYEKAAEAYRDLPWRHTRDPYAIMVSEYMLQQTQVSRVAPKFVEWIGAFPDPSALSQAPLSDVLSLWSGLGYNRRALALVSACAIIAEKFGGRVPNIESELRSLPGIGPYTARAIMAFAFDLPTVFLETNIRTVILKHYFPYRTDVEDRELEAVAALILDRKHPGAWYTAMMDYGAELKRVEGNHSKRGASYKAQSPFETSRRRVRGLVLKRVLESRVIGMDELISSLPCEPEQIRECVLLLAGEGFVTYEGRKVSLSGSV
jgi:A/G-specific adenine glycosylase